MSTLTTQQRELAARLGDLTGESVDQVVARAGSDELRSANTKLSPRIPQLLATQFVAAGVTDGSPYVVLPTGRIFYGLPSAPSHVRQHRLLRGLLDERIPEECFVCALESCTAMSLTGPSPWSCSRAGTGPSSRWGPTSGTRECG